MNVKWYFARTAALFAADEIVKTYVDENFESGKEIRISDRVVLRRVRNRGMCFGVLSENSRLVRNLSIGAAAAVTVIQLAAVALRRGFWLRESLSLIVAGAWSNTVDRVLRGYVVDYVGFGDGDGKLSKLTYNLGDFMIAAGGILYFAFSLFTKKPKTDERHRKIEDMK